MPNAMTMNNKKARASPRTSRSLYDSPTISGKFKKRHVKHSAYHKMIISGDINAKDGKGRSLLFYSARYDQIDPARQLLQAGCNPNEADVDGKTPLHEAVEKTNLEMIKLLLKEGRADVNARNKLGQTPLMIAVILGQREMVKLLHKNGADLKTADLLGNSPMHCALQYGWDDVSDYLLDHKCDVNEKDSDGYSVFYLATHAEKAASVRFLKKLTRTDYDFQKDSIWLLKEKCPRRLRQEHKLYHKILEKSQLRTRDRSGSIFETGRMRLVETLRRFST